MRIQIDNNNFSISTVSNKKQVITVPADYELKKGKYRVDASEWELKFQLDITVLSEGRVFNRGRDLFGDKIEGIKDLPVKYIYITHKYVKCNQPNGPKKEK